MTNQLHPVILTPLFVILSPSCVILTLERSEGEESLRLTQDDNQPHIMPIPPSVILRQTPKNLRSFA